jgi:2'-5' RNA ligase
MTFTIRNVRRDFPEWHLGRSHYALWALAVDTARVRQRVHAAQNHLAAWLLDGYCRQPHITVGLCGFPSAAPQRDDDFGCMALQKQIEALRRARPSSFDIAIGGLASFSSVPYLTVQAPTVPLHALRQCLATADMNCAPGQYTPHVTVGLYAQVWPLSELQKEFDRFEDPQALHLEVHSLSLMAYATHEIGGPLQTLAEYDFASGALRWSETLPAALQDFAAVR